MQKHFIANIDTNFVKFTWKLTSIKCIVINKLQTLKKEHLHNVCFSLYDCMQNRFTETMFTLVTLERAPTNRASM